MVVEMIFSLPIASYSAGCSAGCLVVESAFSLAGELEIDLATRLAVELVFLLSVELVFSLAVELVFSPSVELVFPLSVELVIKLVIKQRGERGIGKAGDRCWDGDVYSGGEGRLQSALEHRKVLPVLLSDSQAAIAAVRKAGQTGRASSRKRWRKCGRGRRIWDQTPSDLHE